MRLQLLERRRPGGTISTPADPERGWQRTTFDSTHSFVSSFVYMLPWGPDGKWLREGALGKVLGDWQVTGVVSAISGTPIDFTANAAGLRAPGNSNTPNATGNAGRARRYRVGRALVRHVGVLGARRRTRGATSSGAVCWTGPAYYNLDASIVKIIRCRNEAR